MRPEYHRTNPTGLVRIARKSLTLSIELDPVDASATAFRITELDLDNYKLPDNAKLVVVAYTGHDEMRGDMGTVGNPKTGWKFAFGFDNAGACTFRLLVRKESSPELLATCEQIRALRDGEDETSFQALLPVSYPDLGQRLWRVGLEKGLRPVLEINNCAKPDLRSRMEAKDPMLRGLVVPQAFEQVLVYLAHHWDSFDEEGHWTTLWKRKLVELGVDDPPQDESDPEKIMGWARDATDVFVDRYMFVKDAARAEINDD